MLEILILAGVLPATLCANETQTLVATANRIETAYILEDVASRVADQLRVMANERPVAATCRPKEDFAKALTKTLRTISGDGHFYIESQAKEENTNWIGTWRASGFERGQGVTHVEILDGNIGYIRIKSFYELEPAFPHYRAAFDMVAGTTALILDFRSNHGGSPQTAWPLQWTFLKPGSPSPTTIESRLENSEPREEPAVLWQRYGTERPVAVLTNGDTFSAPESVAFALQTTGRATVVGEISGGGAHLLDDGIDLLTGFILYTPTKRPISVATGKNWETTGIRPDIRVPSAQAVETAARYLRTGSKNDAHE
ncbi:MAG: S41 family peptidase [Pseudomonadota bacterium]